MDSVDQLADSLYHSKPTWDKKHLIEIDPFSREDIERLFELADILLPFSGIEKEQTNKKQPLEICKGKIMKLWFGEPSTRTYGSFEAAMKRLGGDAFKFDADASSLKKLESIDHTVRILSGHSDILVDRHSDPRHIYRLTEHSIVPVINGGNGSHQHPTQSLQDGYIMKKITGKVDGHKVVFVGDLKYGRTAHSLIRFLGKFDGIEIDGLSPRGLEMPEENISNVRYRQHSIDTRYLKDVLTEINPDFIYATRVQDERISWWERLLNGSRYRYQITANTLENLPDVYLMHPLPIATNAKYGPEIATELDNDPRTIYFKQADYGVPIRMAIITTLLGYEQEILALRN